MSAIIEVKGVNKRFRSHKRFAGPLGFLKTLFTRDFNETVALDGISFSVEEGKAIGFLGINGAGKSTMLKILTGVLVPDSGDVKVLGRVPHSARRRNALEIGAVFGHKTQLWWDLPVRDSFDLHKSLYRIPNATYLQRLSEMTELLDLAEILDRPVRNLSLGQRMRAGLALSMLHQPKLLFLDEPTIGLDVFAKASIRAFLKEARSRWNCTIILTSHDMQDIEIVCDDLLIIHAGQIEYQGSVNALHTAIGAKRILQLRFTNDPGVINIARAELALDSGLVKKFYVSADSGIRDFVHLADEVEELTDIRIDEPEIEGVLRQFYSRYQSVHDK